MQKKIDDKMPVLFLSHGAATLTMDPSEQSYQSLASVGTYLALLKPKGIILISAHDERKHFTVSTSQKMEMVYDHPAAKGLHWSGKGDPVIAQQIIEKLNYFGVKAEMGIPHIDHGAWIPLVHLFPNGDLPIVSLSIRSDGDAEAHYALGEAISTLADQGLLILASGGATHNQNRFRESYFAGNNSSHTEDFSRDFDSWLRETICLPILTRKQALLTAHNLPGFTMAHPTPDHWMPVLIASGAAAGRIGKPITDGFQHTLSMSAFLFD